MRKKLNDYFEFPLELNLEQYSQKSIRKRQVLEKLRTGTIESELTGEERALLKLRIPQDYYVYKLCGVIIHKGTANYGHYVSIAVDRESGSQWYEFNDSFVEHFSLDQLPAEAFGRADKSNNAYMLVYERTTFFEMPAVRKVLEELKTEDDGVRASEKFEELKVDYGKFFDVRAAEEVEKELSNEDERNRQLKVVINANLIDLINTICKNCKYSKQDDYKLVKSLNLQRVPFSSEITEHKEYVRQLEKLQFAGIYLLTVVLRITLKSQYFELLRPLRAAAQQDTGFSVWLLETFAHPYILQEFFVDCPNSKSRFVVASLLHAAFLNVYEHEKERIKKYSTNYLKFLAKLQSKTSIKPFEFPNETATAKKALFIEQPKQGLPYCIVFVYNLFTLMPRVLESTFAVPQYFFLLSTICKKRPLITNFLLENKLFGCLVEILQETIGESVVEVTKKNFIIPSKEPSLGFQSVMAEKSKASHDFNTSSLRAKCYRFIVELFFLVLPN